MKVALLMMVLVLTTSLVQAGECVDCHRNETPAAVTQWQASAHADKVGCAECHGTDHEQILAGQRPVDAKTCGACHATAYAEHTRSRHGLSLHAGWGCTRNLPDRDLRECRFCHEEGSTRPKTTVQCARFLSQTAEMRAIGCNRCHQVETSCASCHTNHITDLAAVRRPEVCATCHMGPDHPQWEMWQTSRHGVLYQALGPEAGPACQQCHMPEGSHDVSFGITMTPGMQWLDDELRATRRAEMLGVCQDCHGRGFAERELAAGDAVRDQSVALVDEAAEIIRQVADRDELVPTLSERPPHPLLPGHLVLDGQMLYEDVSHIERLFFKMKKFDLAKTVKGAYHQNPAYTHWYGNAELKMTLVDIRAEAARLAGEGAVAQAAPDRESGSLAAIEKELQTLKNRFRRGALSESDYAARRAELLEQLPQRRP